MMPPPGKRLSYFSGFSSSLFLNWEQEVLIPLNFIRVAIIFHFKITCLFSVSYFGYFFASIWAAALIVPWCQLMFSSQRSLRASQRGLRASERSEGQLEGSEG